MYIFCMRLNFCGLLDQDEDSTQQNTQQSTYEHTTQQQSTSYQSGISTQDIFME